MRTVTRRRGPRWLVTTAVVVSVAALAGGCGGGTQSTMSGTGGASSGLADRPQAGDARGTAAESLSGREDAGRAPGRVDRPLVQTRAVIRKGEIWLVTKEMDRARTEVEDLLARLGGYVSSEDSANDRAGRPERSVLVLRVPEPAFDDAMHDLRSLGRTERAEQTSEDVTTQVIDVDSRVATQEASLARLRSFLKQAKDVEDMVRVESQIASRQAELESLKAQQKYLHDQTAMSTVTVHLRTPAAPPPPAKGDSGFLAGLKGGWHALTVVLVGGATVAGALLPFALVLALLGVPVWLLVRGARRRHAGTAPAATEQGT